MRFAARTLMIGVALSCAIGVGAQAIRARAQPSVAVLFRQLQSPKTSEPAEKQLLKLAASDARARRYLADHLPALIEQDPGKPWPDQAEARQEWLSAVNLAGELALVEAAPALTKWMSMRVPFGITSENMEAGLLNSPAGYALYQIGDPAIPQCKASSSEAMETIVGARTSASMPSTCSLTLTLRNQWRCFGTMRKTARIASWQTS